MPADFLHHHPNFKDLLAITGEQLGIDPVLVEKDYWIMQCLYGLQRLGFSFELKGGTSLSKGFGIINRFSEDIDIRIDPPEDQRVMAGRHPDKPSHIESRKNFYDWLAATIRIDGIIAVERDHAFDDPKKFRSGGIRLLYQEDHGSKADLKDGVLLEVGFDDVTPNTLKTISSWAYDYGASRIDVIDNRAVDVPCYDPGYTLVEKLQTISTKFRQQQESGTFPQNFLRHYYDVFCLLDQPAVQDFIGCEDYTRHKTRRFRSEEQDLTANEAFQLSDPETFSAYEQAYEATQSLYYRDRPSFNEILRRIKDFAVNL